MTDPKYGQREEPTEAAKKQVEMISQTAKPEPLGFVGKFVLVVVGLVLLSVAVPFIIALWKWVL